MPITIAIECKRNHLNMYIKVERRTCPPSPQAMASLRKIQIAKKGTDPVSLWSENMSNLRRPRLQVHLQFQ